MFRNHLLGEGVTQNRIVEVALDDITNRKFRGASELYEQVKRHIGAENIFYV